MMKTETLILCEIDARIVSTNKLYKLAEIALVCIEKAEKDPRCIIDFNVWHTAFADGHYMVGLEGAAMVFGLGVNKNRSHGPDYFNDAVQSRLGVIEMLGNGDVNGAYYEIHGVLPKNKNEANFFIWPYNGGEGERSGESSQDAWKHDMRHMIACLKEDDM